MPETDERDGRKPFASFLQEQRAGALHGELSDVLADLVTAVDEHRKPGTVTLQIKIAPNKDDVTVTVTDKVTVKMPEGERGAAIFFAGADGSLSRSNPRQQELPLKQVPAPAPIREAAAADGAS